MRERRLRPACGAQLPPGAGQVMRGAGLGQAMAVVMKVTVVMVTVVTMELVKRTVVMTQMTKVVNVKTR